ncbi:hypothetical protein Lfu02_48420 [Longispora fulva]|uniref:Uncharacterized protein n=1 Tax=Longispora fulva TaxID=619741 RepID=A0A8J7GKA8_9ACTN|nr:hypothetical protein [Longispora fulva]MBG6138218.1 hypothetical protein [Longispora fulva]GIG60470.1 hypothetical protein Lfu02_48420 [Longispora fulva]
MRIHRALTIVAVAVAATVGFASPAFAATKLTQAQAASQLSAAGITHSSSGGCTDRNNSTCTSYEQINQSTVSGIITFKRISGCAINITGGTETGHSSGTYSHWNGYKVDVSKTTCVTNYIKGHYSHVGVIPGWGDQWKAPSGNLYTDEGTHWDILYYTCGC